MSLEFLNEDTGKLKKAVFCFTGKSPKTRPEMQSIAINAGASVTKSITNSTTILVIADANSMSIKARKARDNGIDLISPEQFFEMCDLVAVTDVAKLEHIISPNQLSIEKPKSGGKMRHSLVRRVEL